MGFRNEMMMCENVFNVHKNYLNDHEVINNIINKTFIKLKKKTMKNTFKLFVRYKKL